MNVCEEGVKAHGVHQYAGGGSIPASSLHYWFNETDAAMDLVKKFHYSHRWPSNVQFVCSAHISGGLFGNKGEPVAAVVFSIPPTRWAEPVWELSRLVRADDVRVPLSSMVSMAVRRMKRMDTPGVIVSFADMTHGHHGGVYQACGWRYHGVRERSMDGVVVNGVFVPGRSANSKWGTRSPKRLAELGVEAEPHFDEGKHLYWIAFGEGLARASRLGLESNKYCKPGEVA